MTAAGLPTCPLCGTDGPLKVSHIVPAFVFRWLRETSSTGHIRAGDAPARRVQDGLKKPWLCGSCEAMFCAFERRFCNELFNPWSAGEVRCVDYGEWLIRFCVSVSWRVLRHGMEQQPMDHLSDVQRAAAINAELTWRRFLLGELPHPGRFEQHLIAWLGPLKGGHQDDLPNNFNRYLMRGTGIDVFTTGGGAAFTSAKMGRFSVFGTIAPAKQKWEGTKVHLNGRLPCLRLVFPGFLREYLKMQALKMKAADQAIPVHHRARIERDLRQNLDRFQASDQFAVMMHDADAFGLEALIWSPPKNSAN